MKGVNKAALTELKSLATPPADVVRVVSAMAILLGHSVDEAKRWDRLKRIMGDACLCQRIESLDVSTVSVEAAQAAQTAMKDLTPEQGSNRGSAGSLRGGRDFQGTAPATFNMIASADHARQAISFLPMNSAF